MKFSQIVSTIVLSKVSANLEIPITKTTTSLPRDWSKLENPNIKFATRFDKEDTKKTGEVAIPLSND